VKFVINAKEPFIIGQGGPAYSGKPSSTSKPFGTITTENHRAIVVPTLVRASDISKTQSQSTTKEKNSFIATLAHGEESPSGVKRWGSGIRDINLPMQTVLANGNGAALVTAFLAKHYGGVIGTDLRKPIGTITSVDHHSLVTAYVSKMRGDNLGHGANEPLHTVSAGGTHHALVAALLVKYYGNERDGVDISEPMHTIPTKDRFGLVTVLIDGETYVITDIGMRMLQPHELFPAQGFPPHYIHNFEFKSKPLTKTNQVKMCGNSVCPPVAREIVKANYKEKQILEIAA